MHRSTLLSLTVFAGLALTVFASTTACGEGLVSPLAPDAFPTSSPATSPPPSPTTTTRPPTRRRPPTRAPRSTTLTATPTPACMGPFVTVQADTELGSFCIEVGGTLRVEGAGPDTVTYEPAENASYFDAGGAVELQFTRAGTVTVSIHRDGQIHPISVFVR